MQNCPGLSHGGGNAISKVPLIFLSSQVLRVENFVDRIELSNELLHPLKDNARTTVRVMEFGAYPPSILGPSVQRLFSTVRFCNCRTHHHNDGSPVPLVTFLFLPSEKLF